MNSLSWLLYLADVANGLNAACAGVLAGSAIFWIVCAFMFFATDDGENIPDAAKRFGTRAAKMVAVACVTALVVSVVVPSKDTIYAIAASALGEEVLKSETVGKAHRALNAWLDAQIEDEKVEP